MSYHFRKHYDLDEARALLPSIREWLQELWTLRDDLEKLETQLRGLAEKGADQGGPRVNDSIRKIAEIKSVLKKFHDREILIKDLRRGLIDFPALRGDQEIFLCWEMGEEDIEHWHDLESGYPGREKI